MKKLYIYAIIVASTLAGGALCGFGAKKLFGPKVIDDSNIDITKYVVDANAIVNKIDGSGKSPENIINSYSVSDVVNYSMEKFRRCENCATYTWGFSDTTVVKQSIAGATIKNGNNYFEESLSKSNIVSVAARMYQNGIGERITKYEGDKGSISIKKENVGATFKGSDSTVIGNQEYKNTFGKTLDEFFIYLVSPKAILSSSIWEETDTGYKVTLNLDPIISTYFNKLQMKNISNLDEKPQFKDAVLTFYVDESLALTRINIDEHYTAKKIVTAQAHAIIDIYCYGDTYVKIPEINERIEYRVE